MKKADIYYKNQLAGLLTEDEEGYHFAYDKDYLAQPQAKPISLTYPYRKHLTTAVYFSLFLTDSSPKAGYCKLLLTIGNSIPATDLRYFWLCAKIV